MVGMRICGVMMVVMVIMIVVMVMIVVVMMVALILHLKATQARAEGIAQGAIGHVRARRTGALAFDMVVMAFLDRPYLGLEAQNGGGVFAQHTGGRRHIAEGRVPLACGLGQCAALLDGDFLRVT